MSTLRRKLLMTVGSSLPNYSDYRGVYIEDVDGYLYTEDEWDGSKTANGIAVLTDNCRFVMALQDAYTSTCQWGSYGTTVSGITTVTNQTEAQADYDGEAQTTTILSELGNSLSAAPAAYYCRAFTFPNGKEGYLGAGGEWRAVLSSKLSIASALSKCGGSAMRDYYWTSTLYNSSYSWYSNGYYEGDDYLNLYAKNRNNSVRAFTTLKSDKWSEGSEGDSSTANIYWETQSGVWNKDIDSSGNETYTCESPGDSGSTVIRCYFSGVTSITFRCVSYGENNYDYLTVGSIDDYCTRTHYMESLKGENGAYNTITYDCDKGEHFVEFCYSKDSSYSEEPDNASVWVYSYLI